MISGKVFGRFTSKIMRSYLIRRRMGLIVILAMMAALAGWVLLAGGFKHSEILAAAQSALRRPAGSARLISYEPLPLVEMEMCPWEPASAVRRLPALQGNEPSSDQPARASGAASTVDFSKRKPVRMIRDPYSAYSAIAVDTVHNEVVLTDENLFNVVVYDRLANTPPSASMTEPKRMIGGLNTKIEYQCGVYVDPKTGDIYAVNNDTVDATVIFSRQARGDVSPDRELHTPHGTFGIAVDEGHEELMLTIQHDSAVVTFRKMAQPDESPIRLLQGDHTLLADPHGIAFDPKNDLIFVTNYGNVHRHQIDPTGRAQGDWLGRGGGKKNWPLSRDAAVPGSGKNLPPSITVYSRTASGDAAPARVIQGPKTQMNWPSGIAVDPERDEIFVANDIGDSILVFRASASGDVAPIRVLKGSKSLIKNPIGVFLDSKNNELWVANFGNHTATVYKPTAEGDTPPLRVIRSAPLSTPAPGFSNPFPVAYDSKREQILVPN